MYQQITGWLALGTAVPDASYRMHSGSSHLCSPKDLVLLYRLQVSYM